MISLPALIASFKRALSCLQLVFLGTGFPFPPPLAPPLPPPKPEELATCACSSVMRCCATLNFFLGFLMHTLLAMCLLKASGLNLRPQLSKRNRVEGGEVGPGPKTGGSHGGREAVGGSQKGETGGVEGVFSSYCLHGLKSLGFTSAISSKNWSGFLAAMA